MLSPTYKSKDDRMVIGQLERKSQVNNSESMSLSFLRDIMFTPNRTALNISGSGIVTGKRRRSLVGHTAAVLITYPLLTET